MLDARLRRVAGCNTAVMGPFLLISFLPRRPAKSSILDSPVSVLKSTRHHKVKPLNNGHLGGGIESVQKCYFFRETILQYVADLVGGSFLKVTLKKKGKRRKKLYIFSFPPSSLLFLTYKFQPGRHWYAGRRLMRAIPRQVTSALHADVLWSMGHTGMSHTSPLCAWIGAWWTRIVLKQEQSKSYAIL